MVLPSDGNVSYNFDYARDRSPKRRRSTVGVEDRKRGKRREDSSGLFKSEEDRLYLESLDDYSREKELARRFEQELRERHREELLGSRSHPVINSQSNYSSISGATSQPRITSAVPNWDVHGHGWNKTPHNFNTYNNNSTIKQSCSQNNYDYVDGKVNSPRDFKSIERHRGRDNQNLSTSFKQESSSLLFADDKDDTISLTQIPGSEEKKRLGKKLEKSISALTLSLLESIRMSPGLIKTMEEHPQIANYLRGCLVLIPDPSKNLSTGSTSVFIPARITAIEPVKSDSSATFMFDIIAIPIGSTTSQRVPISNLSDRSFDEEDASDIRYRFKQSPSTYELAERFAYLAREKAQQLRQFSFTESDVTEILERKRQQTPIHPNSSPAAFRLCYQRKVDVAAQIEQIKSLLQDLSTTREFRKEQTSLLRELELELHNLNRQISQFRTSTITKDSTLFPDYNTVPLQRHLVSRKSGSSTAYPIPSGTSSLFIYGGGGGRGSFKTSPMSPSRNSNGITSFLNYSFDRLGNTSSFEDETSDRKSDRGISHNGSEALLRLLTSLTSSSGKKMTTQETNDSQAQLASQSGIKTLQPAMWAGVPIIKQMKMLQTIVNTCKSAYLDNIPSILSSPLSRYPPLFNSPECDTKNQLFQKLDSHNIITLKQYRSCTT